MAVEEKLNVEISDSDAEGIQTIQHLVECVDAKANIAAANAVTRQKTPDGCPSVVSGHRRFSRD